MSPLAQSMPNIAAISPAPALLMSSIEFACMRTSRDTFTDRFVRMFVMVSLRFSMP